MKKFVRKLWQKSGGEYDPKTELLIYLMKVLVWWEVFLFLNSKK